MSERKRINIKEFREVGFLQEVNRQFLHPLGLALEIVIDDETGEETLGGVWDYRDDPEGMLFDDKLLATELAAKKVLNVAKLLEAKAQVRKDKFGYVVQPLTK